MVPPKNVLKQNWNEREGKWYFQKGARSALKFFLQKASKWSLPKMY
jgi:hypothetical protein